MIRIWHAKLIDNKGECQMAHPQFIVAMPGFQAGDALIAASPEIWNNYLNEVRRRVRTCHEFPSESWFEENMPDGWSIDLEIIELDVQGVGPLP